MAITYKQSNLIKDFNREHKYKFDPRNFEKTDNELISCMIDNIMSLQRDQNFTIKVISIDVIKDYDTINKILKSFIYTKSFNSSNMPTFDKINLKKSDYYLMLVRYFIKVNTLNDNRSKIIDVPILLPKIVNKYYFRLDNNLYHPIYQITDFSYYNNNIIRLKSTKKTPLNPRTTISTLFTPVHVELANGKIVDSKAHNIKCTNFRLGIFAKNINPFIYVAARMGLEEALYFHNVRGFEIYNSKHDLGDKYYEFIVSNKKNKDGPVYIYVDKYIFNHDNITQSAIYAIISSLNSYSKSFRFDDIFMEHFWTMVIGIEFAPKNPTLEKATNILKSLEAVLDIRTFKKFRLPNEYKRTIHHIILWVMREFNYTSTFDIVNIDHKRLQWAEYIAFQYTSKITFAMYQLSEKGMSVTLTDIERRLKGKPNSLLKRLKGKFNLAPYRDLVNDNDGIIGLKYTLKGVKSNNPDPNKKKKKNNQYSEEFKDVHISHLGRLDPDSSSKSDPGMTGVLSPLNRLYGEFRAFSNYKEPLTYFNKYNKMYKKYTGTELNDLMDTLDTPKLYPIYQGNDIVKNPIEYSLYEKIPEEVGDLDEE